MTTEPDTFQPWNVVIKRGDDWIRPVVARVSVGGAAVNLTGATIRAQVRRSDAVMDVGCDITSAVGGAFTVSLLHAVTELAKVGRWNWDLEVTDSLGRRITRAGGTFDILTDYTYDEPDD